MLTIHNLEVRFDVEGSDEETFARLFRKFIGQWAHEQETRSELAALAEHGRALGDRGQEDSWR